uniref:T-box transcription factor TBX19-like n=1 Tax=Sinocyclocheilus rhinocerous TaxID=307959 RepID=A0A673H0Z2_9TELE
MKVEEELRGGGGAVTGARGSNDCCITRLLSVVESELQAGREKGDPTEKQLKVTLEDSELWRKFKEVTNEMIVTKNGRQKKIFLTFLFLVYLVQIMLNSLHKYEPQIHIVRVGGSHRMVTNISFTDTQFIAVTAYQNEEITALKIKHNPFAKAFLDAKERSHPKNHLELPAENQHMGIPHCGWFISNPDTLCSASGGNFPYPGGLPLTPHHGYKHYPGLHGHRAAPYPSPYLPRHHHHRGHNSVSLSENLSPGAVQMFSGHEGWTGVSPSGPAAMLSMQPAPSSPGVSSQYPCLWTVSSCTVSSSPPGGIVSATHSQEEPADGGSTVTSPCSLLQGHGPTSSEGGVDQANHSRVGGVSWPSVSTHSF